jgi:uncharacterized protein YndB with AHSA1/START domain
VWRALVTPSQIKQYMYGADVESDWRRGSPITWKGQWQGRSYEDRGVIQRVDRWRLLEYTHYSPLSGKPDLPENYHTVTIELTPMGAGASRIALSQDNNDTEEARAHSARNWDAMLAGLKKLVETAG